jgi:hypothetical protein
VRVQTVRESLGGPWFANLAGWLILLPGFTLLVVGQEAALGAASIWLVLVSALLQHVAGGVVLAVAARLGRIGRTLVPLPVAVLGWLVSAVARGLVGGLFATAVVGIRPDLLYRVGAWVLIIAAAQPLATYVLSQIDYRRVLLGQLDAGLASLRVARDEARRSTASRRHRLVSAVRDTIDPVMWEVRSSLTSLSSEADPSLLGRIAAQLQIITDEIDRILSESQVREDAEPTESAPRAQLLAAVEFPPSHYALSVAGTPLLVVAVLAPTAWRSTGIGGVDQVVAAALTSAGVLALVFGLQAGLRAVSEQVRLIALRIGFAFAGAAATAAACVTVLALDTRIDRPILYILPFVVAAAAVLMMGALGISVANQRLAAALADITRDGEKLRTNSAARDRRVSAQVSTLLHGPVIGRLSACVMAINFQPAELSRGSGDGLSPMASRVLGHLEAAASDLELLARK